MAPNQDLPSRVAKMQLDYNDLFVHGNTSGRKAKDDLDASFPSLLFDVRTYISTYDTEARQLDRELRHHLEQVEKKAMDMAKSLQSLHDFTTHWQEQGEDAEAFWISVTGLASMGDTNNIGPCLDQLYSGPFRVVDKIRQNLRTSQAHVDRVRQDFWDGFIKPKKPLGREESVKYAQGIFALLDKVQREAKEKSPFQEH